MDGELAKVIDFVFALLCHHNTDGQFHHSQQMPPLAQSRQAAQ
jgi:hypothetical protein